MKKTILKTSLTVYLLTSIAALLLSSCSQKNKQQKQAEIKQDKIVPPQITILANLPDSCKPKQIFLDNVPKPLTICIPTKPGNSYIKQSEDGYETINLLPPVTHPFIDTLTQLLIASEDYGLGFFTNYNTEQGLALSTIRCGYSDKKGNLWFSTSGGGVSRYDGKSFVNFTTAQGLLSNNVYSITEDKAGNLWFGTNTGGVSRYDGKSFVNFTTAQGLAGNAIRSITEDKAGNLWIATAGGGVSRYDPYSSLKVGGKSPPDGRAGFVNFTTADGLASDKIYCITQDKNGNLWFGSDGGGVSRYDPSNSSILLTTSPLKAGAKSSPGGRAGFVNFTTADGLANNIVRGITEDKNGNLWFATYGGGVSWYDPSTSLRAGGKSFKNFTTVDGLASNVVYTITEDKTGNLWFGTGAGVSLFDGKSFVNFTTVQGLSNNTVRSITEDKTGNLWFGTSGGGLSRYDGKSFVSFTTSQGLAHNTVWNIAEDKTGNIWFGTDGGGLSRYDGKSFTSFTTNQGLANNTINVIADDKTGNLWIGTSGGGVSRYDGKCFVNFTTAQGLANNKVFSITEDIKGNLWFGTNDGVCKYDGNSFVSFTTAQGLVNNNVSAITEDKIGNLWFGTGAGVSRYDGKSFVNFTTAQGLASNNVNSIIADKAGNLWFGTGAGASRYDGKTFLSFTTAQGLADDNVYGLTTDKQVNIIFGTNLGFTVLTGFTHSTRREPALNEINKPAVNSLSNEELKNYKPVFEIYNQNTGYPVKDVNDGAMFCDSKGIIWAGTGDKLVRFDHSAIRKNTEPPAPFIQSLKINNSVICWNDLNPFPLRGEPESKPDSNSTPPNIIEEVTAFRRQLNSDERNSMREKFGDISFDSITKWNPVPQKLVLPYNHNNITFDFGAVEPSRFFMIRFQYILDGYDNDWSPLTEKTTASFGNIHEGDYTFKLKARSPDGAWSEPISYTFKVLPPWYRTWWMYVLYGVITISLIEVFIKWRQRNLKREKIILENKIAVATKVIREEKQRSDELLLNILPAETAEELKNTGKAEAKGFDTVTVMFTDFKNFTQASEKMSAKELVQEINFCYSEFDKIISKHEIEKIKTIGDSYMCAGGLPSVNTTHATDVIEAAIEVRDFILEYKKEKENKNEISFEIRIGVHTGPVVAGIVGIKKYSYDIWGDTVNIASRMESSGEPGKVNISGSTYELVKDKFNCTHRGKIEAKNKGMIDMYFVEEIKN